MSDQSKRDPSFPLPHILEPGEVVESQATAEDSVLAVTSRRIILAEGERTVLDLPFSGLRRIEFDIERGRVASLVIVPEHVTQEPRVVAVPIPKLQETALALARIGEHLNEGESTEGTA